MLTILPINLLIGFILSCRLELLKCTLKHRQCNPDICKHSSRKLHHQKVYKGLKKSNEFRLRKKKEKLQGEIFCKESFYFNEVK